MGYYVELIEQNAKLLKSDLDKAYEIMCELNNHNELKTGGSIGPQIDRSLDAFGPHPNIWFSWMEWNYPETCENAMEIFDALGFDYDFDSEGSLILYGYDDKTGAEDVFLNSLHALWKPIDNSEPCFHAWRGEDGGMWAFHYDEKGAHVKNAKITWV